MIGVLLIAAGLLGLIAAFREYIKGFIDWAKKKIKKILKKIVKAILYLIKKGRRIVSFLKVRQYGKKKWKKKEYSKDVDINDIPDEIKNKLIKGKKVKVKKYA
jgi:hypothetical protein